MLRVTNTFAILEYTSNSNCVKNCNGSVVFEVGNTELQTYCQLQFALRITNMPLFFSYSQQFLGLLLHLFVLFCVVLALVSVSACK